MFNLGFLTYPEFITATGGTITTNGKFKVHTFTSSGTFQITSGAGKVASLVIAGGGGGGGVGGGGGGAGGLIYTTPGAVLGGRVLYRKYSWGRRSGRGMRAKRQLARAAMGAIPNLTG